MTIEQIKTIITEIVQEYPISRVTLFGSRADLSNREDSDVDLIIEFYSSVSLLTLSAIRQQAEEAIGLKVDIVHGPIREGDLLEIKEAVEIYAA